MYSELADELEQERAEADVEVNVGSVVQALNLAGDPKAVCELAVTGLRQMPLHRRRKLSCSHLRRYLTRW